MSSTSKDFLVASVQVLLKRINLSISRANIIDTMVHHPDYPSLLSVTSSLSYWGIPNSASRLSNNDLKKAPTPFIAHLKNNEIAVVTKIENDQISYYHKRYKQEKVEDFLNHWSGISILVSPNNNTSNSNIKDNGFERLFEKISEFKVSALCLVIAIAFTNLLLTLNQALYQLLFSSKLVGLLLCYILSRVADKESKAFDSLCELSPKTSCKEVLSSSSAKLFGTFKLSDIGVVYFGGSLLALSTGALEANISEITATLKPLSLASVGFIFFSIYYQAFKIKKWCLLCLSVMIVLAFDAAIYILLNKGFTIYLMTSTSFIIILYSFVAFACIWSILNHYLTLSTESDTFKARYNRLKNNATVFGALLEASPLTRPTLIETSQLVIGPIDAALQLIVVLSPYCAPCAAAFKNLIKLFEEKNNDIRVTLKFSTFNPDVKDPKNIAILSFASLYHKLDNHSFMQAMAFWYSTMNYDLFYEHYIDDLAQAQPVDSFLDDSIKWMRSAKITHTPTIIVNDHKLPRQYSLKDLRHFITK